MRNIPPRILTDTILFTFSEPSLGTNPFSEKPSFVPISEIPNQFIRGASIKFSDEAIDTMNKAGNRWHFANCVFDNMSSDLSGLRNSHAIEAMDGRFVNCEFKSYKIRPAVSLAGLLGWVLSAPQKCIFRSCDFSSAGLSTVFLNLTLSADVLTIPHAHLNCWMKPKKHSKNLHNKTTLTSNHPDKQLLAVCSDL